MSHTQVLIAGAGPTGLMLGCELARHGIDFRIVDGKSGPTRESRALAVQARTLELWQALGIADEAVAEGRPTVAGNLYVGQRRVQRLPLADTGRDLTPFPYLLILEQSRNEELLLRTLQAAGHRVAWRHKLARIDRNDERGVAVTLRREDGSEEALECDWLVGCDGGHSVVREQLGLRFAGGTYENLFYVADTRVDWDLPHGELTVCLSRETFVLFFPMPGERRYRVIGTMPPDGGGGDEAALRFEDIEASVRAQMDIAVQFSDTAWFSAYRVHHRCVERFGEGRAFLAGDAAHVHSPVGAQGMNTGLQDAANLAWKLALVASGLAHAGLLGSYHTERWPIAQNLLKTTDNAFRLVVSRNAVVRAFRLHVFPQFAALLMGRPSIRRRLFRTISQIGLHYRTSPLSASHTAARRVRAGDRLPYIEVGSPLSPAPISIYAWLASPGFHLLLMQRDASGLEALAHSWRAQFERRWPGWFHVHALGSNTGADALFDALEVGQRALVLVRPDQYIACIAERVDLDTLDTWLVDRLGLR